MANNNEVPENGTGGGNGSGNGDGRENRKDWKLSDLLDPVVLIALIILAGVFVLIGAAMLGMDHGLLTGMAKAEFARGLITYLFAVMTIGTGVILVVYALAYPDEHRYQKGKEILSLFLGIFGTIVGFYFGSEVTNQQRLDALRLVPPVLDQSRVESGGFVTLRSAVVGDEPPYFYGARMDDGDIEYNELVEDSGWIYKTIAVKEVQHDEVITLRVGVKDKSGETVTRAVQLRISGPSNKPQ